MTMKNESPIEGDIFKIQWNRSLQVPPSLCHISIEYSDCFVAFLDILGFKKIVYNTKGNSKLLNDLIDALKINYKFTKSNQKETTEGKIDIRSYFFSDSFVFMIKEKEKHLPHLFLIIRFLQDRLGENGLCLRGAITRGEMYWPKKKENILLGLAMIEAYNLESQIAIYPRIVVIESLFNYITDKEVPAEPLGPSGEKLKEFIKRDKDGVYFFDILNSEIIRKKGEKIESDEGKKTFSIQWDPNDTSNYDSVIENVQDVVVENIKNEDKKIRQKYEWLKSYLEENKTV